MLNVATAVDGQGNYFVEYSQSADLWSLGMILFYMCHGHLPYTHSDVDRLKVEILEIKEYVFHEATNY